MLPRHVHAVSRKSRSGYRAPVCLVLVALMGCHSARPTKQLARPCDRIATNNCIDPSTAKDLARFFLPTFYQERKTDEDAFITATDYAFACDAVGFTPQSLDGAAMTTLDPPSRWAARLLLGTGAADSMPPEAVVKGFRLAPRAPFASMKAAGGPVIYASVRPLRAAGIAHATDRAGQCYVVAYFVLLPFNRAPLDQKLRLLGTYDHEGDLESVQLAVEVTQTGGRRIIEMVMGNHGRRILARVEAIELDERGGAGLHPRIWLDEGSHEPFPFRGTQGLVTNKRGVFYTPKDGDFGGIRELFLRHDAESSEANAIRPSDIRILPSYRLDEPFDLASFAKETLTQRDVEFFMRFPGLYGAGDSPPGPPWNMWDLFARANAEYRAAATRSDESNRH